MVVLFHTIQGVGAVRVRRRVEAEHPGEPLAVVGLDPSRTQLMLSAGGEEQRWPLPLSPLRRLQLIRRVVRSVRPSRVVLYDPSANFAPPAKYLVLAAALQAPRVDIIGVAYEPYRFAYGRAVRTLAGVLRKRGVGHYVLNSLSERARSSYALGRPLRVDIEPLNTCNLKCPVCATGDGSLQRVRGKLSLEKFRTMVEKLGPQLRYINLYHFGEPMIHPQFYDMVRFARDRGIAVKTSTNAVIMDAEQVVDCGLTRLTVAIDGTTQKVYEIYRRAGNLEKALGNMRAVVEEKRKRNASLPIVTWSFIVMKHNEHQIPEVERLAEEIGVDQLYLENMWVRDMDEARRFLPSDERYIRFDTKKLAQGVLAPPEDPHRCQDLWESCVITWDGEVVPCCWDVNNTEPFGNIFKVDDFGEIWNGPRFRDFRRRFMRDKRAIALCKDCPGQGGHYFSA